MPQAFLAIGFFVALSLGRARRAGPSLPDEIHEPRTEVGVQRPSPFLVGVSQVVSGFELFHPCPLTWVQAWRTGEVNGLACSGLVGMSCL